MQASGQDERFKSARILITDDLEENVRLLEDILTLSGYRHLQSTKDPRQTLPLYLAFHPDLVLLDLHMPYLDGVEVIEQLQSHIPEGAYLPIVVLTGDISFEAKQRALSAGAKDFLTKPFIPAEVLLRIRNLLETRFLHLELQQHNETLEEQVRERTWELQERNRDLEQARSEILDRLARAAEFRDDQTYRHTQRVATDAELLCRELGLSEDVVQLISRAAPLHDIGKIGVPDGILLKEGRLTPEEFERMKAHTTIGARILADGRTPLVQLGEQLALTHHERWDGSGYPRGIAGEEIPLASRIVSVADVFDALTHQRPYKPAWSIEAALAEIERQKGRQFDPRVASAFLSLAARGLLLRLGSHGLP